MPDAVSLGQTAVLQKKLRLLMELRRAGIADARVLGAIEKTPREKFVPPSFEDQAYENLALPIGQGQTVSQPYVVALMTEKLEPGARHNGTVAMPEVLKPYMGGQETIEPYG